MKFNSSSQNNTVANICNDYLMVRKEKARIINTSAKQILIQMLRKEFPIISTLSTTV